jgi:hypothetical protein
MKSPCYDCLKYREYVQYLDNILILKQTIQKKFISTHIKTQDQKTHTPDKYCTKKEKQQLQSDYRMMCGRKSLAMIRGYCMICFSLAYYHIKEGEPVPHRLTLKQIQKRLQC